MKLTKTHYLIGAALLGLYLLQKQSSTATTPGTASDTGSFFTTSQATPGTASDTGSFFTTSQATPGGPDAFINSFGAM